MGLHRAGFEVTGVDILPQPRYPFPIIQANVLDLDPAFLTEFDLVLAAPPCQRYTKEAGQAGTRAEHPDLIPATRALLAAAGVPSIIENVETAPLRRDLLLCGSMFGLRLIRHRLFEVTGFEVEQPAHGEHRADYVTVTGHPGGRSKRDGALGRGLVADWREAMGIDWLPARSLALACPPDYTEYIGTYARKALA